jgi:hypothetical protein
MAMNDAISDGDDDSGDGDDDFGVGSRRRRARIAACELPSIVWRNRYPRV